MEKRKELRKFKWSIQAFEAVDFDLLELQLHSLYKPLNINFNSDLYAQDLKRSNGYMKVSESRAVDLAIKSFCKAFTEVMKNHSVEMLEFNSKNIIGYGQYILDVTNSIVIESKSNIKDAITGNSILFRPLDDMTVAQKLTQKERISSLLSSPLTVFRLLRKDAHITIGAATKNMLENLTLWEKSIVECAVRQLKKDINEKGEL